MSFLINKLKKSVSLYLSKHREPEAIEPIAIEEPIVEINETVETIEPIEKEKERQEYEYINEDDLSQKFGIDRDLTKTYKLDVCLYKINKTLEKPFVEYYFEKYGGNFVFIESELTPALFENVEAEPVTSSLAEVESKSEESELEEMPIEEEKEEENPIEGETEIEEKKEEEEQEVEERRIEEADEQPQEKMDLEEEMKQAAKDDGDDEAEKTREEAEKSTAETEKAKIEAEKATSEAEKATSEAEKATSEAEKATSEAEKATSEAEKAKTESEKVKMEAEKATSEAEKANLEAEKAKAESEKAKADLEKDRVESEKNMAEAEKAKAEAEKNMAEAEKAKAEAENAMAEVEKSKAELEKATAEAEKAKEITNPVTDEKTFQASTQISSSQLIPPSSPVPMSPQPVESIPQPAEPNPQPAEPNPQPVQPIPQTVESIPQTVESIPQPVEPNLQPQNQQPVEPNPQPVESIPQPVEPNPQPVESNLQPQNQQIRPIEEKVQDIPKENNIIDIRKNEIKGGDRISDIEEIYLKQCNELITSHLKDVTTKYKGFIEKENKIYAIFEKTDELEIKLINGSRFVLLDEIINKKKVYDIPIPQKITELFQSNHELLKIKHKSGKEIENPISVYMCKKNGVIYENVYEEDKKTEETEEQVYHDTFGNVYLFTTEPINTVGSFFSFFTGGKKAKRYALFLEDETTIDNKNKSLLEYLKEASDSLTGYLTYTCIGYMEAGRNFWAVKSKTLFTEIL